MSKRTYRIGNLEGTSFEGVNERDRWLESHEENNADLPIPDREIKVKRSLLLNSWFDSTCVIPKKKSSLDIQSDLPVEETNSILRCRTISFVTEKPLLDKIKLTMEACAYVYNRCVQLARHRKVVLSQLNRMFITGGGSHISEKIKRRFKGVSFDILQGTVNDFKIAYTTQLEKKKAFKMKFMKKKHRCISIKARQLHQEDNELWFSIREWQDKETIVGPRGGVKTKPVVYTLYSKKTIPIIQHTVRMFLRNKRLHMAIPLDYYPEKQRTNKIVALDPGVRTFQTTYDSRGVSYSIGNDIEELDRIKVKAQKLREGHKRVYSKQNCCLIKVKLSKSTKSMKRCSRRLENKIKNKVSDIHRKLAKFLCNNYDTVIIPPFEVKKMVKKTDRVINEDTVRRMYLWSHYKFQTLLKSKGEQTGTNIEIKNEKYTSKVCSRCLYINKRLGSNKIYKCPNCNLEISRDLNGARNILIKNW